MIVNAIMYIGILYTFGVSIDLFKYLALVPMLLSAFCIDLKLQIIPNRLNLTIFETRTCLYFFNSTIRHDKRH